MCSTTSWFLPRSARNFAKLFLDAGHALSRIVRTPLTTSRTSALSRRSDDIALGRESACSTARARAAAACCVARSASSPLTLASSALLRGHGEDLCRRNRRASARCGTWRSISASTRHGLRRSSHRPSILFRMTRRPAWSTHRRRPGVLFHTSRSVLVTPASAAQDEQECVRIGQQCDSVSSGSVPIAFRPGVSRITRPCCSKRMREVDHRVAPARNVDGALVLALERGDEVVAVVEESIFAREHRPARASPATRGPAPRSCWRPTRGRAAASPTRPA